MKRICSALPFVADLLGVAAFVGIFILVSIDYHAPSNLNIHSFLTGILSVIIALLIGWNIYSTIDLKEYKTKFEREINYAHNKMDYNKAETYAFLSQSASIMLFHTNDIVLKISCVEYGIQSATIFSKLDNCEEQIRNVLDIMIDMLEQSHSLKFDQKTIDNFFLSAGKINRSGIETEFKRFIDKLRSCEN